MTRRMMRKRRLPIILTRKRLGRFIDQRMQEILLNKEMIRIDIVGEATFQARSGPKNVKVTAKPSPDLSDDDRRFCERMVPSATNVLAFADVWRAWCKHTNAPLDAKKPGGVANKQLSRWLVARVPRLDMPKQVALNGRSFRAWKGWRLKAE